MSQTSAVIKVTDRSEKQYPDHILIFLEEAKELKVKGENSKAIELLHDVLCEESECAMAYEELADNFLTLNQIEKAVKAARFVLTLNEKSYIAHYVLGFISLKKEKPEQALPYLSRADELCPNNPEILRCLGWNLFKVGKATKGIILLERVLTILPEDPITLCDLGVCYFELKFFTKALNSFEQALEIDPQNKRAQKMHKATESILTKLGKL